MEIEHTSVSFNMLNSSEECIITYNTGDESEWKSNFATDSSYY